MEKWGSFTLLTELPYFYDERIKDLSESDLSRKDAVLQSLDFTEEADEFIIKTLNKIKDFTDERNPFRLALEAFTDNKESNAATRTMVSVNPDFSKTATVAEKFDNLLVTKFYKMLSYGLLVRASETELTKMAENNEDNQNKEDTLKESFDSALEKLKELSDELEEKINYQVVPIKNLVAIQLECGLLVADYLQKKKVHSI